MPSLLLMLGVLAQAGEPVVRIDSESKELRVRVQRVKNNGTDRTLMRVEMFRLQPSESYTRVWKVKCPDFSTPTSAFFDEKDGSRCVLISDYPLNATEKVFVWIEKGGDQIVTRSLQDLLTENQIDNVPQHMFSSYPGPHSRKYKWCNGGKFNEGGGLDLYAAQKGGFNVNLTIARSKSEVKIRRELFRTEY